MTWINKLRGTKESLDKGERRVKKAGLILNIQKTKIMWSRPITSWQIDREKMKKVTDFIFFGSKITGAVTKVMKLKDACSLEEKVWQT